MGILSDYFFPNTFIHLWNFSGTNFFTSTSDFAASSSSSHISHSSITFLTSTVLPFFCFFFFFFSSFFFSASSFASSFFCFSYPDFSCTGLHCFPHSSGHLVILTSPVFQSISGLWHASHGIPKITPHFCPPITSISILSMCPL